MTIQVGGSTLFGKPTNQATRTATRHPITEAITVTSPRLRAYRITFTTAQATEPYRWIRYVHWDHALDDAREDGMNTLREAYPDGMGGTTAVVQSVEWLAEDDASGAPAFA